MPTILEWHPRLLATNRGNTEFAASPAATINPPQTTIDQTIRYPRKAKSQGIPQWRAQPWTTLEPVVRCQRATPSFSTNFNPAPITIAQARVMPYREPATDEETRSAAPTPVAATAIPGPTSRIIRDTDGRLIVVRPIVRLSLVPEPDAL